MRMCALRGALAARDLPDLGKALSSPGVVLLDMQFPQDAISCAHSPCASACPNGGATAGWQRTYWGLSPRWGRAHEHRIEASRAPYRGPDALACHRRFTMVTSTTGNPS